MPVLLREVWGIVWTPYNRLVDTFLGLLYLCVETKQILDMTALNQFTNGPLLVEF